MSVSTTRRKPAKMEYVKAFRANLAENKTNFKCSRKYATATTTLFSFSDFCYRQTTNAAGGVRDSNIFQVGPFHNPMLFPLPFLLLLPQTISQNRQNT